MELEEGKKKPILLHHAVDIPSLWLTDWKPFLVQAASSKSIRSPRRYKPDTVWRKVTENQSRDAFVGVHTYIYIRPYLHH